MNSKVFLRKIESYDLPQIETFVKDSVSSLAESGTPFQSGQKVLLKPNLLRGDSPDKCITTHPAVVEAVCRMLKDSGVRQIDISDSPAMGSFKFAAQKAGYGLLTGRYGVRFVPFSNPVSLRTEENIPHLKIAGNLQDYDRIVNLPKFKSHRQMTLTLGIKNLFGCVIGKRKPVLHCLVQNDKVKFGRMLVEIARHVNPCLTIVDGIQAMQGNGPLNGEPYPLSLMASARDMTALDRVLAEIVNVPLEKVYALEAARQKKFGNCDMERIDILGVGDWRTLQVTDFRLTDFEMVITFNPLRVAKSILKQIYEIGFKETLAGILPSPKSTP